MNSLQYYLTKLAEEASEVAQIALKTQQFGPNEKHPELDYTNFQRCHQELNDLLAVVDVLNTYFCFGFIPNPVSQEHKKKKMLKYKNYSVELGMVDKEVSNEN